MHLTVTSGGDDLGRACDGKLGRDETMAELGRERDPEEYCHRCGGRNISWYTPGGVWDPVMRPVPGSEWKWNEIICPLCFVELAGGDGTWALLPRRLDGQPWTSADERAAIIAGAVRDAADAACNSQVIDGRAWRWLRDRADRIGGETR